MNARSEDSRGGTSHPSSISSTLLERIRNRRPEAWQRLVDLYGPVVYRWCRQLGVKTPTRPTWPKRFSGPSPPISISFAATGPPIVLAAGCGRSPATKSAITTASGSASRTRKAARTPISNS